MSNSTITRVIILGAIAIIAIISIQSYWVLKTWNIKGDEFDQNVRIALRETAKELAKANASELPANELVTQVSSNYYVVNTEFQIDAGMLQHYLRQELESFSLNETFHFGIYDCSSDSIVFDGICSYEAEPRLNELQTTDLPKYDKFTYYFGVRFPGRSSHLVEQMQLSILFTLLSLLTIGFFIYAITVILRQRRLSQMQKDFINNMTHEFKTPISTIKISSDVFLKHEHIKNDTRLNRYATIIKEQNERLNEQVEKVLQIARLEGESFSLRKESFNINQMLSTLLPGLEVKTQEAKGTITTKIHSSNSTINADKLHLTNIVHNLIDNAIKYCKTKPEISIETSETENNILLKIADKGIGIAKEYQPKLFQKFYRVPTGNVHNVKGFGLGLFYVKNICKAHGWKIWLESTPNVGTQVFIEMKKSKT